MTRLELFRQQAKEFGSIPDSIVNSWFDTALVYMDELLVKISSRKLDLAVVLYTAHILWLEKYPGQGGSSRGPILNEKDDKKEKQYQLIKNSDTWLGQSYYGQSFTQITGIFDRVRSKSSILTRFGT